MTKKDELTPGVAAVLQNVADRVDVDGRSWRSLDAAVRRGLVAIVNGKPKLTSAGRGALGLTRPQRPAQHDPKWKPRKRA